MTTTTVSVGDILAAITAGSSSLKETEAQRGLCEAEATRLAAKAAAQYDLLWLWGNRMIAAARIGQKFATNRCFFGQRVDQPYIEALRDILPPQFKVSRDCSLSILNIHYVRIDWD